MSKYPKVAGWLLATILLAFADPASADIYCPFTISGLTLDTWGNVIGNFTSSGNSYSWFLCSTSGTVTVNNGYGPAGNLTSGSCNALYAQLLTVRASGQTVTLSFHGPASCTPAALPAQSTWLNPFPTYFTF